LRTFDTPAKSTGLASGTAISTRGETLIVVSAA